MDPLYGNHVTLRPVEQDDADALLETLATPEVSRWWPPMPEGFPFDDDECVRLTVLVDGEVAGFAQLLEENDLPYSKSADIDIFMHPRFHGRGLGTDAITTLLRHLTEDRGHHRVTLYTAVDNEVAIRCYERCGFRRVGVVEKSAHDPRTGEWGDELFMERVVPPPGG